MVNIGNIIKGAIYFLAGYFATVILFYILDSPGNLISTLEGITSLNVAPIIWFFVLILFILLVCVLPMYMLYTGLTEQDEQPDKFKNAIIGLLLFAISLALSVKAYYTVEIFATMTSDTFIRMLFYIGLIMTWLAYTIIAPFYLIYSASNNQ